MPRANLSHRSVVHAAALLADREGLDAVTLSSVARSLGVKPASLYEHVAGLTGLFDGLHLLALEELGLRVADAVAGLAVGDALQALGDAHRSYAIERPGAWAALQRRASPAVAQSAEAARIASLILAVLRGYPVPDPDRIHATRLVAATINGFLALTRADAFGHRPDSEDASWFAALDALDRALSTWPAVPDTEEEDS